TSPSITLPGRYDTGFPAASVAEGAVWLAVTCTPARIRSGGLGWAEPLGADAGVPAWPARSTSARPVSAITSAAVTVAAAVHSRPTAPRCGPAAAPVAGASFAGAEAAPASAERSWGVNSRQEAYRS